MGFPREFSLAYRSDTTPGLSPYRLLDAHGTEVSQVNDFLDALATRGLSPRSLRTYGFALLTFWAWLTHEKRDIAGLTEADLFRYICFQYENHKGCTAKTAPVTVNHRLMVAQALYRYHTGKELPAGRGTTRRPPPPYHRGPQAERGYLHPCRPPQRHLRVQAPRRIVVPLTREEVATFLASLRSWRDLSMAALMLLCGLRSREVIQLALSDLLMAEGQLRVWGKGDKERIVPLSREVLSLLRQYLDVERPKTVSPRLFVCLKGRKRGAAITPAGFRGIFRYHRKRSTIERANPHRFRHTFGADMVRGGISLPALMHLMGHASIQTTMLYVALSPRDIWDEFDRVTKSIRRQELRINDDVQNRANRPPVE